MVLGPDVVAFETGVVRISRGFIGNSVSERGAIEYERETRCEWTSSISSSSEEGTREELEGSLFLEPEGRPRRPCLGSAPLRTGSSMKVESKQRIRVAETCAAKMTKFRQVHFIYKRGSNSQNSQTVISYAKRCKL